MSNHNWLTPEEIFKRKKRNKNLLYASLLGITMILSTMLTFLANGL